MAQQITHLTAHVCSTGNGFGLSTSNNRTYVAGTGEECQEQTPEFMYNIVL